MHFIKYYAFRCLSPSINTVPDFPCVDFFKDRGQDFRHFENERVRGKPMEDFLVVFKLVRGTVET